MESISEVVGVLNDLLKINKDRVESYKKASYDTSDPGLKALFWNMADQSRKNITDITKEIIHHHGSSESPEATSAAKIYDAWADFKAKFSGSSVKNVLTACESREAEVLHAYKKAKVKPFSASLIDLIERHEQSLRSSHEVIRVYQQAYSKIDKLFS
jgi:uncharacterized protein (TIGR02284 family)